MRVPSRRTVEARGPSCPSARAFTLIELMVVVVLIGILTVTAIPTMAEARYNARTVDDATMIAELFREARTRSVGRGAATLIQMSSLNLAGSADLGTFMLYESQVPGTGAGGTALLPLPGGSPLSSCSAPITDWSQMLSTTGAATSLIDQVTFNNLTNQRANVWSTLHDPTGLVVAGQICFTPLGRTYYKSGGAQGVAPIFTPGVDVLRGVIQIGVQRADSGGTAAGMRRTVIIPDSGSIRIVSR